MRTSEKQSSAPSRSYFVSVVRSSRGVFAPTIPLSQARTNRAIFSGRLVRRRLTFRQPLFGTHSALTARLALTASGPASGRKTKGLRPSHSIFPSLVHFSHLSLSPSLGHRQIRHGSSYTHR